MPNQQLRTLTALLAALTISGCIERAPGSAARTRERGSTASKYTVAGAVSPQVRNRAIFGGVIELVGYDLEPARVAPGETATLTFFWKAITEVDAQYKVFVHLDGREGQSRINGDHFPAEGRYMTDAWRPGDVVRDRIRFTVPSGFRGDMIDMWIGWFNGEERLHVTNPQDTQHDGEHRVFAGMIPTR